MRWAAKADANQEKVVRALRKLGLEVLHLHRLGQGVPDLLVYWQGSGYHLVELKDPDKAPSQRKLNEREQKFHEEWRGPIHVCETVEEILAAVGMGRKTA